MTQAIENMNFTFVLTLFTKLFLSLVWPRAMRVCFNCITDPAAEFHLFNPKNKHIYQFFKENFAGGPSIIFNQYHVLK